MLSMWDQAAYLPKQIDGICELLGALLRAIWLSGLVVRAYVCV